MIAVIADDFTGAAELAGISLRYGLRVQLTLGETEYDGSDVFIVSTDSRSLNNKQAVQITRDVVYNLQAYQPEFIYKKIDSVLRGHVLDELKVQAELTKKEKVFILPANPSLGKIIRDGRYFINEKEIHLTPFSSDPEFAITNSSVLQMLSSNGEERIARISDELPNHGTIVGEAASSEDIRNWAEKIDTGWLLAGAGDFYQELLGLRYSEVSLAPYVLETPHLYISGTTFDKSRNYISHLSREKEYVVLINNGNVSEWLDRVNQILKEENNCVIAIAESISADSAVELRKLTAELTRMVVAENDIAELFIEGGATAAAILGELHLQTFQPVNELQRGVVRMKAAGIFFTVKPGSYDIPEQIKKLYS